MRSAGWRYLRLSRALSVLIVRVWVLRRLENLPLDLKTSPAPLGPWYCFVSSWWPENAGQEVGANLTQAFDGQECSRHLPRPHLLLERFQTLSLWFLAVFPVHHPTRIEVALDVLAPLPWSKS